MKALAYPEATREQLIIAIKRAQTEINLRITAVNGWHLDYDITDKRWEKLERMKVHSMPIGLTPKNTKCGAPNVLGQEEYPVAKYSITIFETMTYGRFNLQRGDADMRKPPRRMKSIS
jgi:hypothetical protein